tara:strand:+ start:591 stop:701 length:111 start_codon:yes stop_codon:yes gene_type:complete
MLDFDYITEVVNFDSMFMIYWFLGHYDMYLQINVNF